MGKVVTFASVVMPATTVCMAIYPWEHLASHPRGSRACCPAKLITSPESSISRENPNPTTPQRAPTDPSVKGFSGVHDSLTGPQPSAATGTPPQLSRSPQPPLPASHSFPTAPASADLCSVPGLFNTSSNLLMQLLDSRHTLPHLCPSSTQQLATAWAYKVHQLYLEDPYSSRL